MKQYLAIYIDPCENDTYHLLLTESLEEAKGAPNVSHVVVFEDGIPVDEYEYFPPRQEVVGFDTSLPEGAGACYYAPLPIYGDEVTPAKWERTPGYARYT